MRVDLHTHILPGIDDGARTVEESLSLLKMQRESGVDTVVLSPHFAPQTQEVGSFLRRREEALRTLQQTPEAKDIDLRLAAEVRYSEYIANIDALPQLCVQDTRFLLLELPYSAILNEKLFSAVRRLVDECDIVPVIVHAERYLAVQRDPLSVLKFRHIGCLIQINAESVLHPALWGCARRLMKADLADILASDCHNTQRRPPNLSLGYAAIEKQYGAALREKMEFKAGAVVRDQRWWE